MQLKNRLVLLNLSVIGATALLLVGSVYLLMSHQMRQEMWGFLSDEFREYSQKYEGSLDDLPALEKEMREHFTQARMAYPIMCHLYDRDGNMVVHVDNVPGSPRAGPLSVAEALRGRESQYTLESGAAGGVYWCAMRRVVSPSGKPFAFELGLRIDRVNARIERLRNWLLAAVPAVLLVSAAGAWWVAGRSLRPFGALVATLRRIRTLSQDQRLPVRGTGDEVDRLAEAINEMLTSLAEAFALVRDFTGDAAHELRTPLARLTLMLEKNLDRSPTAEEARDLLDEAYEECTRLRRLVDDLMLLARLDAGELEGELVPVDLAETLKDLEELWSTAGEERRIRIQVVCPTGLLVQGRPVLLRRLLTNLVDNAIRHTPAGGAIDVTACHRAGGVEIAVKDTGSGIPAEEIPRIFNRFYRVGPDRGRESGGTGLGLSICLKIVQLHKGVLEAESRPGGGSTFCARIPAIAPGVAQNKEKA